MAERSRVLLLWKVPLRRLVLLTFALAPLVLLVIIAAFWIKSRTPEWVFWKIGLVFLIVIEIVCGIAAALSLLGALVCGVLLGSRNRQRTTGLGAVARGLLLSISILAALTMAEAASAFWQYWSHRHTALPIGGLRGTTSLAGGVRLSELPGVDQLPSRFPDSRDDRQIDILVLGESSAEGVPFNRWLSIGVMIEWKLKEIFPARPVWLQILATSRETLEQQQEKLRLMSRRPEIMIIYCGHNEFSTRLAPYRDLVYYFDDALPTAWSLLIDQVEAVSPLFGMLRENIEKCRIAIPPPEDGYRDLIDTPAYTSTEYSTLLVDFRRRLDLLVSYAEKLGALPILIAPPANDTGFEPNRSFLPAATPRHEREAFRRDFLDAKRHEHSDPARAIAAYRSLLVRQPGFAEAHYRLAQLLERQHAWNEAYEHYTQARDQDGYPMRALTAYQDIYREIATRHGCILIDGQAYFHAIGHHGLLDDFLFQDGMHPSLRGQMALAQRTLQAMRDRRALGWPEDEPAPVIDPSECARRFRLGRAAWQEICLWGIMFNDLTSGMRYDPSQRLRKRQLFAMAATRLAAGEAPEALELPNVGIPQPVPLLAPSKAE
jgi:tetratricopeptide (TPR) repeat protein